VVTTPLLLRELIDKGVIPKNPVLVTKLAILVGFLAIFGAGFNIFGRWYSARIGEGLIYDLRSQVFAHIQRQSIAFFTRTQTGALISRINSDVMGAQQAFTGTLSGVVSNVVSLILVVTTMLVLSWQITVVSLLLLPFFLLPTKWVGKRIQGLTRDAFNLNATMSSTMTERFNVSGALLVSLYGKPSQEESFFRSRARKLLYGLYGPLTALSNVRIDVMTSLVSFERVFEVLDLQPMIVDKAAAKQFTDRSATIDFVDVAFTYPKAEEISLASLESAAKPETVESGEVLKGVSFHAPAGTLTAIVGPSGAGKTTISALVPRLYDVTRGSIQINGEDIRNFAVQSLRDSIGVVMQDAHLFHETIAENLRYAKEDATFEEMKAACESARIWTLIDSLPNGLDTMVGERGHRLSGGEKQRLAIARLLLKAPAVVILDEATAHLDSENEALVHEALRVALQGRTSIVIAHRLSTVMEADQILVLDNGLIVERGRHDELVNAKGLYAELYARQDLSGSA